MSSTARTPNHDEGLSAQDNITGRQKYLTGTSSAGKFSLDTSGAGGGGSYPANVISTVNTSTTPLTSAATFTGTSEDVSAYADIRVAVFSDVASATDGLSMQQSEDGTNWDFTDTYTIAANTGKVFDVPSYAKFFRVVYTNGATPQGTFRLQTVYHISRTKPSSQRPMDARSNENDMEENLAYGMTYNVAGNNWNRAKDIGVAGIPAAGITDGTNAVNVVAGDTGFNGVATTSATKTIAFTTSSSGAQIFGPYTAEGYSWVEVALDSVGVGLALSGQFSPTSGGNYITSNTFINKDSSPPTNLGNTVNQIYFSPIHGNYFRINVSALTSGTFSGTVTLRANNPGQSSLAVTNSTAFNLQAQVGSNSATGSAVPANAFYIAGQTNAGLLGGVHVSDQDALGSTGALAAGLMVYNGTNLDRARSATAATNTTGTGLLGVGNLMFDGTNWQPLRNLTGQVDNTTTPYLAVVTGSYNGSAIDRTRNNTTAAVIAAGATASNAGVSVTTYNASKAVIIVNVTAITGTLTVTINAITASGYSYPILVSTAIATTGTTPLRIGEGLTASANAVANDILPRTIQVVTVVTGTATYGVDNELSV